MKLTLETAQKIVALALEKRLELGMKPLTIAVLDDGGHLKALAREDGNQHTAARDRSRQSKRCDCNGVGFEGSLQSCPEATLFHPGNE